MRSLWPVFRPRAIFRFGRPDGVSWSQLKNSRAANGTMFDSHGEEARTRAISNRVAPKKV